MDDAAYKDVFDKWGWDGWLLLRIHELTSTQGLSFDEAFDKAEKETDDRRASRPSL